MFASNFSTNSQHIFFLMRDDEEEEEDGANHSLTVRQFKALKAVQLARARAWSQESYFCGR
jgi:hypothetical protein